MKSFQADEVRIDYINWRGERSLRTIIPKSISFGSTQYHKVPQWLLKAYDVDKAAYRDFAMSDIQEWLPLPLGQPDTENQTGEDNG